MASVFAIKGDSSYLKKNSLARRYASGFDSSGAPVWRHRKSINDGATVSPPPKVVPAESSILLARRNRRRLRPFDTAKYCFEEYPRTYTAPLLLLAPLARNTIVLLYDLRRELGKVLPFFSSSGSSSSSAFSRFLRLRFRFVCHHLTHPDSSEVRRFRSYDFYPVNNIDFNMKSSRLWTRSRNLSTSTEDLRIWLSYLRNTTRSADFISRCIRRRSDSFMLIKKSKNQLN